MLTKAQRTERKIIMSRLIPIISAVLLVGGIWVWQSGIFTSNAATSAPAPQAQQSDNTGGGQRRSESQRGRSNASGQRRRSASAAKVVVTQALETKIAPAAETPGTVISSNDSRIAAEVSGKVTWVAEVGDAIDADGVIAILDDAPAKLSVRDSKANLTRLSARANFLDDRYKRFSSLGDDIGESETSLMQFRSERDEALQQVESARIALERAQFQLSRTKVRAPFAGRIAARGIQIGEYANPGSTIARLVDTANLEVRAQTSASLVSAVSPGDQVKVTKGSEQTVGTVRAIVPVGDDITRTLDLRVDLPAQTDWFVGAPVRVLLPSATPRLTIAAPRDALLIRTGEISVYRVTDKNTAEKVVVELGVADGDLIEIIGDIAAGDRLVVRGGERLRDGQNVDILKQNPPNARG